MISQDQLPLEGTSFSVFAWVKLDSISSSTAGIFWNADTQFQFMGIEKNTGKLFYRNAYLEKYAKTTVAVPVGEWVHVGVVIDENLNPTLYINGVAVSQTATAVGYSASASNCFRLGVMGSNYFLDGLLDDVRIYDHELSADEIVAIAGTTYAYDAAGQLIRQTDPAGNPVEYRYDSLGRLIETLLPETTGQTDLGDVNNGVAATDGATGTGYIMYSAVDVFTRFDPDPHANNSDHLVAVKYISGQWYYDDDSNYQTFTPVSTDVLIAAVDFTGDTIASLEGVDGVEQGIVKGYIAGDLTFVADWWNGAYNNGEFTVGGTYFIRYADAAVTEYAYDAAGNLLTLTDAEDNTTTWVYDALGRMISETNELDDARSFIYNAAGLLVRKIDREGRVIVYGYDNLYRNTTEIWYNNVTDADADQNRQNTITYTYDAAGYLLTASDPTASYAYTYDALGRLTEETQTIAGLTPVIVFSSQYSAVSRRTQLAAEIGGTDDFVNSYSYDALGRLEWIKQDDQGGYAVAEKRVDFTYDAASRYATISRYKDTDGGGANLVMTGTYTFDSLGRLTDLVYTDSTPATIRDFAWTYDAAGRMVSHDSDIASEDVSAYTHDDTNQLTDADYTTGTDEAYTYDENGNRVTANGSSYETDTNNRLVSDDYFRYEYDAEGNLIYRYVDADSSDTLNTGDTDITAYTWDHRNRMTDVAHKAVFGGAVDWTAEYIYDVFNRRIASLYDTDGDSALDREERYVWNGRNVVLDFIDTDGDGGGASLDLTTRYLWGNAVDQLLAQETYDDGGVEDVLWPITDNLGSVRSLVDYTGTITSTYSYDSFGNVNVLVGSITDTRYGFTCQEYDIVIGDYYYDARWYDPAIGKFISEDPSGLTPDVNLTRYVGNNPLTHIDPEGLGKYPHHWRGTKDGKPGWYYQWEYWDSNWFGIKYNVSFGPIEFVPDNPVTGEVPFNQVILPDGSRPGLEGQKSGLGNAAEQVEHGAVIAGTIIMIGIPGPEDVLFAGATKIAGKYGGRLIQRGGKWVIEKIGGGKFTAKETKAITKELRGLTPPKSTSKAVTTPVGGRVRTPTTHPGDFVRNKSGQYINKKTGEVWEKSHTRHSGGDEWKVGPKKGKCPKPNNKITVAPDGTILKKDL